MEREDTVPWYRQFWPWFIIALPASAVVAGLYTLWLAIQTTDSLVVQSDDGMNVVTEKNLAAERKAIRLGLSALVDIHPETGAVKVTVTSTTRLDAALNLRLRHPTMASRDKLIELLPGIPDPAGNQTWAGHFVEPIGGRYFLILSSDQWRLSTEWTGQEQTRLAPSGQPANGER